MVVIKTYVISDVHGLWEKFSAFLNFINEDDKVYVLGDVIDRGPDGVRILKYIMEHQNQFNMLLGNHELMMREFLDLHRQMEEDNYNDNYYNYSLRSKKYTQWVVYNSGDPTLTDYEDLNESEKTEIYDFLCNLPAAFTNVTVGENIFYLVHASPGRSDKDIILQKDLREGEIHTYVWERPIYPEWCYLNKKIVVTGHTIVGHYHPYLDVFVSKDKEGKIRYIDIDCGCAMGPEKGRLACLCLDDLSVTYF